MPEVICQEYFGHISVISSISQSHAKLWPDIAKCYKVMASYSQDMPRYAKLCIALARNDKVIKMYAKIWTAVAKLCKIIVKYGQTIPS